MFNNSIYSKPLTDCLQEYVTMLGNTGRINPSIVQYIHQFWNQYGLNFINQMDQKYPGNRMSIQDAQNEIQGFVNTALNQIQQQANMQSRMMMNNGMLLGNQPSYFGGSPYGVQQGMFGQQPNNFATNGSFFNAGAGVPLGNSNGNPYGSSVPEPTNTTQPTTAPATQPKNQGVSFTTTPENQGWQIPINNQLSPIRNITTSKAKITLTPYLDGNNGQNIDVITGVLEECFSDPYEAVRKAIRISGSEHNNKYAQVTYTKLSVYDIPPADVIKVLKQVKAAIAKDNPEDPSKLKAVIKVLNRATKGTAEFIETIILEDFNRFGASGALRSSDCSTPDSYQIILDDIKDLLEIMNPDTDIQAFRNLQAYAEFVPKVRDIISCGIMRFLSTCEVLDPADDVSRTKIAIAMPNYTHLDGETSYCLEDIPVLLKQSQEKKNNKPTDVALAAARIVNDMLVELQEFTVIARPAMVGYSSMPIPVMIASQYHLFVDGFIIEGAYESNLEFCIGELSNCLSPWTLFVEPIKKTMIEYVLAPCLTEGAKKAVRFHPARI